MPVMDEFREEREELKNSSFKKKIAYFWDYYKWHVIVAIVVILAVISFTKDILANKEFIFHGFFLNSYGEDSVIQAYMDEFAEIAELDTENYAVVLDSSLKLELDSYDNSTMVTVNRIVVHISAGDLDFLAADPAAFEHYATSESFYDLTTILSAKQLEDYAPYFYYVDMAEIERKNNTESPEDYIPEEYDHKNPDSMEKPLLVGLYINDCKELSNIFRYKESDAIIGIPKTTKHLETSLKFIDYIFQ